jgi:hypothetical protein
MYIRSHDGLGRRELPLTYGTPGLSDVKETETSPEVANKLTNLVFFARYPELKGREVKGNRKLEWEWTKIKDQLVKPSSAGNSTGFVIDLTVPQVDPQPNYSKTEDQLGVWEWAIFRGNRPFKFSTQKTVMPNGKPGSYVSMLSVRFDKPQFAVFIAKHLWENSHDQSKSREYRHAWRQTLLPVLTHAYVHLKLFRRAAEDMENVLQELFNRLLPLPSAKKPLAVSKDRLDEYLNSLGEFLIAILKLEFWEKTCDWEKKDYPELSQKILAHV